MEEEILLTAPDMSCGHCEAAIREAVGALDGVQRVAASAATKEVLVTFDPTRISLDRIAAAMDEAGYPVGVNRPDR